MTFETILDETRAREYVERGLWLNRTIVDAFDQAVSRYPEKVLVVASRGIRWTYREVAERVEVLAANLARLGVGRGDVISAQLPNWGEFVLVHLAATRLGAITNALLPIYRSKDVRYILGLAKTKVAIIPDSFRGFDYAAMYKEAQAELPELKHVVVVGDECADGFTPFSALLQDSGAPAVPRYQFDGNDVTLLIFTSGTEASPKGVMHSHNTLMFGNVVGAKLLGLTSDEVVWGVSPVTHATGIEWNLRQAIVLGATVVLQEQWDVEAALDLIERERCTYTCAATPFATMLLESPTLKDRDLSSFRVLLCGGAAIPSTLGAEAKKRIGCDLVACWGMSECFAATMGTVRDPQERRWGNDGQALPGAEVAIFDEERAKQLQPGQVGEIATRGPHVSLGYLRDPERTRASFSDDGWLFSGDLGVIDKGGYLNVVGRMKDVINRGGLKLSAREVEELIVMHPSVKNVALVGVPDTRLGEKACACVVLRESASLTLEDLCDFLKEKGIATYKLPEYLHLVEALPMTPTGKIQKFKLRDDFSKLLRSP